MSMQAALLFDLDGTLIDSTYHHVFAWHQVFTRHRIDVQLWKVHRLIGISGKRLVGQLLTDAGQYSEGAMIEALEASHAEIYRSIGADTRPFPAASELLQALTTRNIPWAIATTGKLESVKKDLHALGIDLQKAAVITRDDVAGGKPEPDIFIKAAETLEIPIERCIVVGDSIWDMLAAARGRALAVGLRCGGTEADALTRAGAIRVYEGPTDLLRNLADLVAE